MPSGERSPLNPSLVLRGPPRSHLALPVMLKGRPLGTYSLSRLPPPEPLLLSEQLRLQLKNKTNSHQSGRGVRCPWHSAAGPAHVPGSAGLPSRAVSLPLPLPAVEGDGERASGQRGGGHPSLRGTKTSPSWAAFKLGLFSDPQRPPLLSPLLARLWGSRYPEPTPPRRAPQLTARQATTPPPNSYSLEGKGEGESSDSHTSCRRERLLANDPSTRSY